MNDEGVQDAAREMLEEVMQSALQEVREAEGRLMACAFATYSHFQVHDRGEPVANILPACQVEGVD